MFKLTRVPAFSLAVGKLRGQEEVLRQLRNDFKHNHTGRRRICVARGSRTDISVSPKRVFPSLIYWRSFGMGVEWSQGVSSGSRGILASLLTCGARRLLPGVII